ncbi:MAG: ABC transporter substrate-binding protein, partial [Candidatus Binatia bacterium]
MEPYGISYNTDMIKEAEGQKLTWEDCANPKWKGKVAVIDRPRHLEVLYQDSAWGREKTLDYARRLAANNPIVERSRDEAFTKLLKGAYPMLCGDRSQGVLQEKASGAKNVDIAFPEPIPIVHVTFMFVPRAAKSPHAGMLWIAWALSEEGQKIHDETEFTGNPMMPSSAVYKRIQGKKVPGISWGVLARSDDILREILTAMGFPIVQ